MMKLGLIAPPFADSFEKVAARGVDYTEWTMNVGADIADYENRLPAMRAESDKTGVKVGSIGRWGSLRADENGDFLPEELENERRLIESCGYMGCPVYVTGYNLSEKLSYFENVSRAIDYFQKLIDFGKSSGVKIATYNCEWNSFVVRDEQWKLIHGHLPELGIKFDSANAVYNHCDYLQQARDWGDRFYHVHLKGHLLVQGQRYDDPPAGLDQTDWPSLLAILYAKQYDGVLSIEPHSEHWNGELGEKGIDYTISYFKKLLI